MAILSFLDLKNRTKRRLLRALLSILFAVFISVISFGARNTFVGILVILGASIVILPALHYFLVLITGKGLLDKHDFPDSVVGTKKGL